MGLIIPGINYLGGEFQKMTRKFCMKFGQKGVKIDFFQTWLNDWYFKGFSTPAGQPYYDNVGLKEPLVLVFETLFK